MAESPEEVAVPSDNDREMEKQKSPKLLRTRKEILSTHCDKPAGSRAKRQCVVVSEPLLDLETINSAAMTERNENSSVSPAPRDDVSKVLEDLLENDRLYQAELLVILDCYRRPLRIAMNSGLLPISHQQLKAIFQNCENLQVLHASMLPQLEGALSKSVIDFATTFSLFVPQIKMLYADVIRNYKTKYEVLSQCLAIPAFSSLLENHHYSRDRDATQLKILLKSPPTKLERYQKFLSEAVACSIRDSDEAKSLQATLELLQSAKEELVSDISPFEEEQCIVEILHRRGPKAFLLTEPDCRLVKRGFVQIKLHSVFHHKCYPVKIFLFSSCLVFLSEKEKKQLNYILPLSGATIYEHVSELGEVTHLRDPNISIKSMKIYSPGGPRTGVVVLLETQAEKRVWFKSISEAIFHSTVDVDDTGLLQLPMQEVSLSLKRRSMAHNEGYSVTNMFAFLLSPPTHHQNTFVNTFLLSYQLFTNGHEVLSFLSEAHQTEIEQKRNHDRTPSTQALKCLTCIKSWVTKYGLEICQNIELQRELLSYLVWVQEQKGLSNSEKQLVESIAKIITDHKQTSTLKNPGMRMAISSTILISKFVDLNSQMVAQQLTWAEHKIYCAIHPQELLNQRWTKKNKQELAPTVCTTIKRFNLMNNWAVHEMLSQPTAKERKIVIQHMVVVAQTCSKLKNFSSMFQLVAALTSTAVQRLQKTWDLVSKKTLDDLRELQKIASVAGGSRLYRTRQREVTPPSVPYLGAYLNQLVSIEVGMPTFLPHAPEHVNYSKLQKLALLIEELCQFQTSAYSDIRPNETVLMYFDKALEAVENFDQEKQFAKSEELEARH